MIFAYKCIEDDLYLTCTFSMGHAKMLITPNQKELSTLKLGRKLPQSVAIIIPNLILFCWTVVQKWSQNVYTHNCTCSCDDLYRV